MEDASTSIQGVPENGTKCPKTKSSVLFLQLPDVVLFAIFGKCDIKTLGRLCRVCHKLNNLIQLDSVWLSKTEGMFIIGSSCLTTQTRTTGAPEGRTSNQKRTCLKEQCRLSHNWTMKKYKEKVMCRFNPRQLPWLQYVDGLLWCSMNNTIKCYNVPREGNLREEFKRRLYLQDKRCHRKRTVSTEDDQHYPNLHNEDVSRFIVKGNLAVSGCRDGSLYIFDKEKGECLEKLCRVHKTDTQSVDLHNSCILTGSRDKTVKILHMSESEEHTEVNMSIDMQDRVWSTSWSPHGQCFAVGTSGCKGSLPLTVWDSTSGELLSSLGKLRYGAGILDMKFEDEHTLLSCGYEACLKMWDLRTHQCVAVWQEPFDSTLYCVQTDNNVAMVTGTARHGMLRLWDKRKPEPVQEYFMSQKSPVYSVAFDTHKLYAALDSSISMMKFSVLPR